VAIVQGKKGDYLITCQSTAEFRDEVERGCASVAASFVATAETSSRLLPHRSGDYAIVMGTDDSEARARVPIAFITTISKPSRDHRRRGLRRHDPAPTVGTHEYDP
jgi:hypothetical protein